MPGLGQSGMVRTAARSSASVPASSGSVPSANAVTVIVMLAPAVMRPVSRPGCA